MTGDKHIAFLIPMLIGAFIFWILSGFRGKYKEQLNEKYTNKNFWTGYVLSMLSLAGIVYIILF